ncbi:MAG: polysaccharide deacetylase family protein [Anaerolineales bacterium]|nr:polysaccharide deacetylase family protein [Anaerolineales bacterium]
MTSTPRLMLTIDYESWYALSRRYDHITSAERHKLDENFARNALDPILEKLGDKKITFYLVGELVEWYPELPQKIFNAGHEVGFHCQVHRPLTTVADIKQDFASSAEWRKKYQVRGYRAPMIKTIEALYPLLEENQFTYSSSLYAPTGTQIKKGNVWEFPVSAYPLWKRPKELQASRHMTPTLLLGGEFPYASSMMSGLFPKTVFRIIEKELKRGLSPILFLHPYEIIKPERWFQRIAGDVLQHPLLYPFTWNKSSFLDELLRSFPTSSVIDFVNEQIHADSKN